MSREERFSSIAYEQALESELNWKHGAVITKGSKIIVKGKNIGTRTKCLNKIHSCIHAEIDVANQLIKRYLRKKISKNNKNQSLKKLLKKYIVWVVRADTSIEDCKLKNSMPCNFCLQTLKNLGFVKIGFSNQYGAIQMCKLCDLNCSYYTSSQKMYKKYYKN